MTIINSDLVLLEDEERLILYDVDDVLGPVNQRTMWKPGSTGANQSQLEAKLIQARDYFGGNFVNWPTMTNAQKDAANRQAQRALANMARYLLNDFSSGGD